MSISKTIDQIDAEFADPTKTMDLTWDKSHWRWTHDDWYRFLEITPDYLIQKCRAKGIDVDDTLMAWDNMLHNVKKLRVPTSKENLGSIMWDESKKKEHELKYFEKIPEAIESDIKNYRNTIDRDAEMISYKECNLKSSKLGMETAERGLCHSNVLCRPPTVIDGTEVDRTVYNDEDYDRVEGSPLPESEKKKYRRCRYLKETCPEPFIEGTEYNVKDFTHLPNGGTGDCLFVAVYHYEALCKQLGDVMGQEYHYPIPGINSEYDVAELEKRKLDPLDYTELKEKAKILRKQVCDYYIEHPNYILFAGRSIKHELAVLNIDGNTYNMSSYIKQYNDYVNSITGNNPLKLDLIPLGKKNVFQSKTVKDAIAIINSYTVDPTLEAAWDHFTTAMYNNYIAQMRIDTTYGGNIEIAVLSKILKKNIFVLQLSGTHFTSNWGSKYPSTVDTLYIYHTASVKGKGGLHFEVLIPLDAKYIQGSATDASSLLDDSSDIESIDRYSLDSEMLDSESIDRYSLDSDMQDSEMQDSESIDSLDSVLAFISDSFNLNIDNDEEIVIQTLVTSLTNPDLDRSLTIELYFNHDLQQVNNESVFEVFNSFLFNEKTDIDLNLLYIALLPSAKKKFNDIDIVTNYIIPYTYPVEDVLSNIYQNQYREWFNMLDNAIQYKLLENLLDIAVGLVDVTTYDPDSPPDTYNVNAENRLILYTVSTAPVHNIVIQMQPFHSEIKATTSIINAMIKVRHMYEKFTGEITKLKNDLEYRQHWDFDDDEDINYNVPDDIEPILEIFLMKQISTQLEEGLSNELTQLVLALKYHIIYLYSQIFPMIYLMCKKNKKPLPLLFFPNAENITLYSLMSLVSTMNKEDFDIINDII